MSTHAKRGHAYHGLKIGLPEVVDQANVSQRFAPFFTTPNLSPETTIGLDMVAWDRLPLLHFRMSRHKAEPISACAKIDTRANDWLSGECVRDPLVIFLHLFFDGTRGVSTTIPGCQTRATYWPSCAYVAIFSRRLLLQQVRHVQIHSAKGVAASMFWCALSYWNGHFE